MLLSIMNEKGKTLKAYIKIFLFLLIVIAITLALWKFRHKFDFSFEKIEITPEVENTTSYDIYKVKIDKVARDIYYIKFSDVICDGAKDYDGTPHYFRIDVTFETSNKDDANKVYEYRMRVIDNLRRITKDLRAVDNNNLKVMDYTKYHIRKSVEQIVGRQNLKGVYFESFLSQ